MAESSLVVQEYYKNPVNNFAMDGYTVKQEQWNVVCGDNVVVYLKIDSSWTVVDFSYSGEPSLITSAAASLLADLIVGENIEKVLLWNYQLFLDNQFCVSYRRRRAVVGALLAARNAIHFYIKDWIIDNYDDLFE